MDVVKCVLKKLEFGFLYCLGFCVLLMTERVVVIIDVVILVIVRWYFLKELGSESLSVGFVDVCIVDY